MKISQLSVLYFGALWTWVIAAVIAVLLGPDGREWLSENQVNAVVAVIVVLGPLSLAISLYGWFGHRPLLPTFSRFVLAVPVLGAIVGAAAGAAWDRIGGARECAWAEHLSEGDPAPLIDYLRSAQPFIDQLVISSTLTGEIVVRGTVTNKTGSTVRLEQYSIAFIDAAGSTIGREVGHLPSGNFAQGFAGILDPGFVSDFAVRAKRVPSAARRDTVGVYVYFCIQPS